MRISDWSSDVCSSDLNGALTLTSVRVGSKGAIARFAEITDRTAAEGLRGTALTVPRASLPPLGEGEYYHVDLVGLPVVTDAGPPAGRVVAVEKFGAGDLLEVEDSTGRRGLGRAAWRARVGKYG